MNRIKYKAGLGICALALGLAGCGPSYEVTVGSHGETSPAESGQYGATADRGAPYGPAETADAEHKITPIEGEITNDKTDPSMEGSGNIAAQGNYAEVVKEPPPRLAVTP